MTVRPAPRSEYSAAVFADSSAVDAPAWNRLAGPGLFGSWQWMRGAEAVFAPNSRFIVACDGGGRPVAGLACFLAGPDSYLFVNPPRLLVSDSLLTATGLLPHGAARAAGLASRLRPLLARRYPVAVCVSPFSPAGGIVGRVARDPVARCLVDQFHVLARQWGARATAFLSVSEPAHPALGPVLAEQGYGRAIMAAHCTLPVRWGSIEGYVDCLGRARRPNVRRELRAFAGSGLRAEVADGSQLGRIADDLAPLFANLQRKYGHEPSIRAARETLDWVACYLAPVTRVVLVKDGSRTVAFHLFYETGGRLYSYLFGQAYEDRLRGAFVYFNAVFYEPIRWAVRTGARVIDFSNESYEAKALRGCQLQPMTGFFRFGDDLQPALAELVALVDAAQRARFRRYAGPEDSSR
jgi:predicted N-acyltransferase